MIKNICISILSATYLSIGSFSTAESIATIDEQSAFFATLQSLCGSRFVGEMTFPTEGQDSFKDKELVADFKTCSNEEIRIPFSVGEDTSRTWIIRKTVDGIEFKHDHRHSDGTPDEVTNYGGNTLTVGEVLKQTFPADAFTKQLIPAASTNVWSMELSKDLSSLVYHLERHEKPRFTAVLYKKDPAL
ncbi:hypothetical protein [Arenicella sp. 4NH20-0111]|uniref:hypothetical protein n=1 Tax=Arenicella sp. 4NH20-0111 TaxID=3127648 RepID=UPI003341A2B3